VTTVTVNTTSALLGQKPLHRAGRAGHSRDSFLAMSMQERDVGVM